MRLLGANRGEPGSGKITKLPTPGLLEFAAARLLMSSFLVGEGGGSGGMCVRKSVFTSCPENNDPF